MLRGRQAWQLPSRWRLHSHWRTHVSADLLKAFDSTCPERHRLIRWRWVSSARAGLIRTIGTAHQPVARWRVRTEVFALMIFRVDRQSLFYYVSCWTLRKGDICPLC
jgi:hypothetical protein